MTNEKRIRILIAALIAAIAFAAVKPAVADEFVFAVPLYLSQESEGLDEEQASKMLQKVCDSISTATGDNIKCLTISKPLDSLLTPENIEKFIKSLEDVDYSLIYVSSNDYYRLVSSGYDQLRPAITMTFFKKKYDQACFYTLDDEPLKEIEDLRGRTWGGSYFYMASRYILYNNKVDERLDDFFADTVLERDDSWPAMADLLLEGKISVFTGSIEEESMGRNRKKEYKKIKKQFCEKFRSTHLIAFRKTMPKEKMKQYRTVLLKAHKSKAFQDFKFIFAAIQGHFVPFDPEAFEYTKTFVDTSNERGWLDEHLKFINPGP